ncbi:hypothetical protein [Demequina iriomotensis]|uniref:hypothetical protein n=1 Tax=Demequina iriomotensis TaxID=1536641 RepID=UPI0007801D1E|nr:hypothetical protein [Demequina iriomotensis]
MGDDGWSRAFMAASGVPVASERADDGSRALVNEARADGLDRARILALGAHRVPEVREAIAARSDCPIGMQATLAHDRRASVRVALAAGRGLAAGVAAELAEDRELAVVKALARNARTPRAVLEVLAANRREDVARLARRALDGVQLDARHRAAEDPALSVRGPAPGEAAASRDAQAASPVGDRTARVLAPRPQVGRRDGASGAARGSPA